MENIPDFSDIVILGGGPTGSTAATLLSQKGYQVVLLEKARHPRPIVGESILPHFWKYCDITKTTPKIESENFIKKAGATVCWHGKIRQLQFKDFGYTRSGLHVERDCFDHLLLKHAKEEGANVFEEVSAKEVQLSDGENPRITYKRKGENENREISCRYVIDATGQSALLSKQLGTRIIDEGFRFIAMWGYFKGSKYVASDGHAYSMDKIRTILPTTFLSSICEWGWSWHIPMR